jgi:hypothetical protein
MGDYTRIADAHVNSVELFRRQLALAAIELFIGQDGIRIAWQPTRWHRSLLQIKVCPRKQHIKVFIGQIKVNRWQSVQITHVLVELYALSILPCERFVLLLLQAPSTQLSLHVYLLVWQVLPLRLWWSWFVIWYQTWCMCEPVAGLY